uniref:E3 ubiquitin-protein ligase RNF34-like n=1 Tax=Phallusia mammillata TaxID=59560 RepID=A0A6F9DRX7_9ASCI|nr:E3 ubiquitin-protein ligase RNF34-like [Phallusia mammillata]
MPCLYCNAQFNIAKWKNKCILCHQNHCSQCVVQKKCRPCFTVIRTEYRRAQLMQVKVKDLQLYLKNRSFSIETIKEKHELVRKIQSVEGVHEPDAETQNYSYNNMRHTNLDETIHEDMTTSAGEEVNAEVNVSNQFDVSEPVVPPPSYTATQSSFPTAAEFSTSATSPSSTSSNTEATTSQSNPFPNQSASPSSKASTPRKGELLKLSEISSIDEIQDFSVRQLKYLLKDSLVDYRGLLEKKELLNRALNLFKDNEKNQQVIDESEVPSSEPSTEARNEHVCKICWENPVDCVFLECAHMATCIVCSKAIRECPICRETISRTVRVFKS